MTAPDNGWYATIEGDNLTVSVMVDTNTPSGLNEQRATLMAQQAVANIFRDLRAAEANRGRS